ncbi:MAG: toxin-antitoxin system YwqK family antitoxin [Sphingobacteriales bacterium]
MKRILVIFLLVSTGAVYAQKMPELSLYKIHIYGNDKTVVAEIKEINSKVHLKPCVFYYWYSADAIHTTQGSYSGTLLNGQYDEYYLNKNIKEQGTFNKGVKTGIWRTWNEDGTLNQAEKWKNGVLNKGPVSFWRRINIFKWFKKIC